MKFGLFYEHQLPRPWDDHSECEPLQQALEQCELADRLGADAFHQLLESVARDASVGDTSLITPWREGKGGPPLPGLGS